MGFWVEYQGESKDLSIWLEPQPFGFPFPWKFPLFFQGIPMEMVRIWEPLGMIPSGIHGIPLEFCWNSMGNSFTLIVKNSTTVKIQTLVLVTHHVSKQRYVLAAALCDHRKYTKWTTLIPIVMWLHPKQTLAFANICFGCDQQQTMVVVQPPPSTAIHDTQHCPSPTATTPLNHHQPHTTHGTPHTTHGTRPHQCIPTTTP